MRMAKVQFGPDNGCFVAVLQVPDIETEEFIRKKASEAVKKDFGIGDDDLEACGKSVLEFVEDVVTYSVTE